MVHRASYIASHWPPQPGEVWRLHIISGGGKRCHLAMVNTFEESYMVNTFQAALVHQLGQRKIRAEIKMLCVETGVYDGPKQHFEVSNIIRKTPETNKNNIKVKKERHYTSMCKGRT